MLHLTFLTIHNPLKKMFFFFVAQILEPQRLVCHLLLPHQAGPVMKWMFLVVLLFLRETHQFSRISKSQREASAPNQGNAKCTQVFSVVSGRNFALLQDRRRYFSCYCVVLKGNILNYHGMNHCKNLRREISCWTLFPVF